ncbi:MAG TPA: hypothetical protein VII78_01585 [Myxococcota bacterium]
MSDPRVQAAYMRALSVSLARLGAAGERVRAADPELFRIVAEAPRSGWLPVALNMRWVQAVAHVYGWPDALDFLAARVLDQFANPLYRGLVHGGVRLLGLDPGLLVRIVPRGLSVTFRDCGAWTAVRTSRSSVELRASELPKEIASHARWLESIGAGALAMFAVCRVQGRVRLAEHRPEAGSAVVEARWDAAGRR